MSYALCIWDPSRHAPLPTSREEAIEIAERLANRADSVNMKFIEFGESLVERYQLTANEKSTNDSLLTFWGCDPSQLAAVCNSAILRLVIPADECIRQISHAVETAARLGLVVMDDETGLCFLPDGAMLPEADREMWEFNLAEMNAVPPDPNAKKTDGRSFMEKLGGELFDAIGQGNNHQS